MKIGSEGGQSGSLYKTGLLSGGVNFLDICDDERSRLSSGLVFYDIEGTDTLRDRGTDCEVAPELALTFSESSRGPAMVLGSFFSLSWVKGPSS